MISFLLLLSTNMNYLPYVHIYKYTRATCGSAEQPLLGPREKALNQAHPSDRTV